MNRKRLLPSSAALIVIGAIGVMMVFRNPRSEAFHTVDVLQLLASGACFGVALSAIGAALKGSRSS